MNLRKWTVLGLSLAVVTLASGGLSASFDGKLGDLMEKVSAANNKINRAVRTPVTFKKASDGKDIAKEAEELAKLGKEAKAEKDHAKGTKGVENPEKKWDELMDAFIKSSEDLAAAASKGDQAASKEAHTKVKATCADCHKVFRAEGDDF
jgi:cytochrome c556